MHSYRSAARTVYTDTQTHMRSHIHTQTHEAKHLHPHIANWVVFIIHTRTRRRQRWKGTHVELSPTHTHVRCSVLLCCSVLQCVAVLLHKSRVCRHAHMCNHMYTGSPGGGYISGAKLQAFPLAFSYAPSFLGCPLLVCLALYSLFHSDSHPLCFFPLSLSLSVLLSQSLSLFLSASRCILCSAIIHNLFLFPLSLSLCLIVSVSLPLLICLALHTLFHTALSFLSTSSPHHSSVLQCVAARCGVLQLHTLFHSNLYPLSFSFSFSFAFSFSFFFSFFSLSLSLSLYVSLSLSLSLSLSFIVSPVLSSAHSRTLSLPHPLVFPFPPSSLNSHL